jgi:hypothetical protein
MTDSDKESEQQKGLSPAAWTAISAISVAVIGGIVTLVDTILKNHPAPSSTSSPSSTGSVILSSPSPSPLGSTPQPSSPSPLPSSPSASTGSPSADLSAQNLVQRLNAVNIDFSVAKLQAQLSNPSSQYPQFAEGCLKLLSNERLKNKAYFDVIFWNYTDELKGKVNSDAPDGDLNTTTLKAAMVEAYNTRNGRNALFFGDIVEPKQ